MKSVLVLMSTYNGERYIKEQLESILLQQGVGIKLFIRDDGSSDKTEEIILELMEKHTNIKFVKGNNIGFKKSFLWLLDNAEHSDYYAFADQDDVWLNDKLVVAIEKLSQENNDVPLLYTSALQRVDEKLNKIGVQSFPGLKLNLYSEFVRHRFAGCTYVFNNKLREVCKGTSYIEGFNYAHDSWLSLMCWAAGGKILFDKTSHILFRRYGSNASIDNATKIQRIKYEFGFFNTGKYLKSNISKIILKYYKNYITQEARQLFVWAAKSKKLKYRNIILTDKRMDCGIPAGNLLFKICVITGCL